MQLAATPPEARFPPSGACALFFLFFSCFFERRLSLHLLKANKGFLLRHHGRQGHNKTKKAQLAKKKQLPVRPARRNNLDQPQLPTPLPERYFSPRCRGHCVHPPGRSRCAAFSVSSAACSSLLPSVCVACSSLLCRSCRTRGRRPWRSMC